MLVSVDLIEKYKEILNSPIKISFVGKVSKNNKEKQNIINQYLEVASKYIDLNIMQVICIEFKIANYFKKLKIYNQPVICSNK